MIYETISHLPGPTNWLGSSQTAPLYCLSSAAAVTHNKAACEDATPQQKLFSCHDDTHGADAKHFFYNTNITATLVCFLRWTLASAVV